MHDEKYENELKMVENLYMGFCDNGRVICYDVRCTMFDFISVLCLIL